MKPDRTGQPYERCKTCWKASDKSMEFHPEEWEAK